ncbi:hypothetical protein, conserved [Plasmodium gonderi]|uniref:Variable surface protein n=1 Tax=Plasmodium gonderi TaxID=77519 RepID=A0A1Y1JP60_PLAGO|nr:hypothetical protein, conserved [Plasmodium gonderi]GAW83225.1 hypothetical protein, conserved [Plasmodium gonderi]
MKTLIHNIIFVLLVIWKYNYSFNVNTTTNSTMCIENVAEDLSKQQFGRIMTESFENQLYREGFDLNVNTKHNSLYNTASIGESNKHDEELKELCSKISTIWKDSIEGMEQEYNEQTGHIEKSWSEGIWNNKWAKYLEHIHNTIQKELNNLNESPHNIEVNIAFIISHVYSVFAQFLEEVIKDSKTLGKM